MKNEALNEFIKNYSTESFASDYYLDLNYRFKIYFYSYVKELFYDHTVYKWKIKKFDKFIKDNNLDFKICIEILQLVSDYPYYILYPGDKGFIEFVNKLKLRLKNSKKQDSNQRIRIKINSKFSIEDIYYNLKDNNINATNEKIITFLATNCDTGYSHSTLRSYFYEKKLIPEK